MNMKTHIIWMHTILYRYNRERAVFISISVVPFKGSLHHSTGDTFGTGFCCWISSATVLISSIPYENPADWRKDVIQDRPGIDERNEERGVTGNDHYT